jgi:hypothetical protein
MNTILARLSDSLKSYLIDVKYLEPGVGDAHITLGNREFLQKHHADLTAAQREQLNVADATVLKIANHHYADEHDDDLRIIHFMALMIQGHVKPGDSIP